MEIKMIPVDRRGIPANYPKPKNTHERAFYKKLILFDWTARFGFTSMSIVAELWGVDISVANRGVRMYIKEGYVTEIQTTSCRDKRVFILKPQALKFINEYHLTPVKYSTKKSNLPLKTLVHDLMVQYFLIINLNSGNFLFFYNEKEQCKGADGKTRRFDAVAFDMNNQKWIAIECEASIKFMKQRKKLLKQYELKLEQGEVDSILFFSHKRRNVRDCERLHEKIMKSDESHCNELLNSSLKYIYNKQITALIYSKFWDF